MRRLSFAWYRMNLLKEFLQSIPKRKSFLLLNKCLQFKQVSAHSLQECQICLTVMKLVARSSYSSRFGLSRLGIILLFCGAGTLSSGYMTGIRRCSTFYVMSRFHDMKLMPKTYMHTTRLEISTNCVLCIHTTCSILTQSIL